jgi:hypothetical protein
MSLEHTRAYKAAYLTYLRTGLPIELSLKQLRPTERYVWETRGDAKVRLSHRRNDGKIFRWDTPPPTGHPGQDYNCRCLALPFEEGKTEYAYMVDLDSLASTGRRWTDLDFVDHFYHGGGRAVTLADIGQFEEIVQEYAYFSGGDGAYHRLKGQIADWARNPRDPIYPFKGSYSFSKVAFSHGNATVRGEFRGSIVSKGGMLKIDGVCSFNFFDVFTDPISVQERFAGINTGTPQVSDLLYALSDLGGYAYQVTGHWQAQFHAFVLKDRTKSAYHALA